MQFLLSLVAVATAASGVHAQSYDSNNYYIKHLKTLAVSANAPSTQYIDIPVDHFGNTKGTFKNRYWYNDQHYQSGGPVVIMDVGESDASDFVPFLEEDAGVTSAVMELARQYKGIGVIWEHRNYGASLIGGVSSVTRYTKAQWQLHTVDQALEDVVYFSTKFATVSVKNDQLKPSNTPWIFIGGSYPGMRAALLRVRNPNIIFASWASSAPVEAQLDMSSYWRTVQNALPTNCSTDLIEMASFIDGAFKGSNETLANAVKTQMIKAHLGGSLTGYTQADIDKVPDATVATFTVDPFFDWQNAGLPLAIDVCDYLETVGNQVAPTAGGVVAKYGVGPFFEAWLSAVTHLKSQSSRAAAAKVGDDVPVITMKGAPAPTTDVLSAAVELDTVSNQSADTAQDASISWLYSVCSEFGFFQVSDTKGKSFISSLVTMDQKLASCKQTFKDAIPDKPVVSNINKYGGWGMNPSRTFFSNGELDPWMTLSPASKEDNSPKRSPSSTVPAYNKGGDGSSFYGVTYPKTVHAMDLAAFATSSDPTRKAAFETGYAMFTKALDVWLPDFKKAQQEDQQNADNTHFNNTGSSGTNNGNGNGNNGNSGPNGAAWQGAPWAVVVTIVTLCGALLA